MALTKGNGPLSFETFVRMVAGAFAEACPHCSAGDPFFDDARTEHVIRTEAGCGVTKCLARSGTC
jgi:hypothetical protein